MVALDKWKHASYKTLTSINIRIESNASVYCAQVTSGCDNDAFVCREVLCQSR